MPPPSPPSLPTSPRPYPHAPLTPSGLRQSRTMSSSTMSDDTPENAAGAGPSNRPDTPKDQFAETSSLLHHERIHDGPCDHGTFSPRATSPPPRFGNPDADAGSVDDSDGSTPSSETLLKRSWKKTFSNRVKSKKMTTSSNLAHQHGVEDSWGMYLSYYIPFLTWIRQYKWSWLKGDFTAAITIASMYLPMALSYAENLAHVPAINGLYAFAINPFVYALLGSCPLMVVGPEAAGSLLIGSIIKNTIDLGRGNDDNAALQAEVAGVAVGIAGATVFLMGVFRLGFLDSVLSRPFLRGFISAIGVVIFIDQLIPVLGLNRAAKSATGVAHGSTVQKLEFVLTHLGERHNLTATVGLVGFVVIMVFR